jgi:phospholipid/cholesterol/gamma-HCH transport system substrate-binding protein
MKENFVETLVGVVVIAISALFIAYGYSVTDTQGSDRVEITADFERIDGLTIGSDVRLSGVKIGTVTSTELDKESFSARVNMSLDSSIELPDDSSAKITSEGLLGGNYISIVPGGSDMALESGGEIMFTQGSVDLMSLISQAMFSAGNASNESQ